MTIMHNVKLLLEQRQRVASSTYADVQVEMTRMVFDGVMPTIMLGSFSMVSSTMIFAHYYSDPFLWWLSVAMIVASGVRAASVRLFL